MRRHRILAFFDFDTRSRRLTEPIREEWEESIKAQHRQNRENIVRRLKSEFGKVEIDQKIQNFVDLGTKPVSIIAFHNAFFSQVRSSFVVGSYYPALTGACALGERILNHLILIIERRIQINARVQEGISKEFL
ncbi:MAG: hypothetical protein A2Y79_07875 [Deltaproteobacteria bacterium RBG_13_43_22]|nr:MAG: hypothetical protein A2Y79_07875 [Deltaproteobacteria bacterium RBG_13_43_22]